MLKNPKPRPSLSQAVLLGRPSAPRPSPTPPSQDFWRTSLTGDRDRFLRGWVDRRRADLLAELSRLDFSTHSHRAAELKGRLLCLDDLFGEAEGRQLYGVYKEWLGRIE